jgi:CRISPR system Cascade subunit CasB
MTQTDQLEQAEQPETKKGREDLGSVGNAVSDRVEELMNGYLDDRSEAVATLAQLRGGAGKSFGACPQLWGLTVDAQEYEEPGWSRRQQDQAEEAVHAALTLFALHQQSVRGASGQGAEQRPAPADADNAHEPKKAAQRGNRMHRRVRYFDGERGRLPDHGLGWAVRACMARGEIDRALHNRLKKAAQAGSFTTRMSELRQIVVRLRKERIPLDYGLLADQLFQAQEPGGMKQVRDEWGHGFVSYRTPKKNDGALGTTPDDPTTDPEKETQ